MTGRAAMVLAVTLIVIAPHGLAGGTHGWQGAAERANEMEEARRDMAAHMGGQTTTMVMADRLEYLRHDGDSALVWDLDVWHGGDLHKLWVKTEGERQLEPGEFTDAEVQLLYSRAISPFFDLQAGVRRDFEPGPSRSHVAVGLHGLAPHWFEVDAAMFLSDRGDVTARLEFEYELLVTQRLILQPRFELGLAARDVPEAGIGAGLGTADAELRLRYEIRRSFAPYVGVSWQRTYGATRDLRRLAGADTSATAFVAGVRIWF